MASLYKTLNRQRTRSRGRGLRLDPLGCIRLHSEGPRLLGSIRFSGERTGIEIDMDEHELRSLHEQIGTALDSPFAREHGGGAS